MISKTLKALDRALTVFEDWTLFLAVMAGLLALFFNVVLRYGFNYSLAWSEELIREIIIYTTFIGCSAAIRNRSMIKIDALAQFVPRFKWILDYFSNLATLAYAAVVFHLGWKMASLQAATFQKTIILKIPLVLLYAVLPLMAAMMFIRTIQVMYQDFAASRGRAVED